MPILNAAKKLDRDALVNLFDTYSHPLYEYAYRMCRDPHQSDRIVGDAFDCLLNHLSEIQGPARNLRSYLFQITYQRLTAEVQGTPNSNESADNLTNTTWPAPLDFWKALTIEQRHIVILRFLEGLSRSETANIMGKKAHQIKSIEYRAIKILAGTLDAQELM